MEGGKWGLVIIFSAFMIQFLAFGTTACIGVYNIELLHYFDGATVGVSLIGSINFGVFLGSGPIVSFLMTKFSYRKIALFGSFLIVMGLIGMPLLPYIPSMCICFGLLTGFGSCCAYIPSHVLSGLYYDKYRSLATGVTTSGSGLGGAVMPVIAGLLIDSYSWKGSFIVIAGLCLHLFVFSSLLRRPPTLLAKDREQQIGVDKNNAKEQNSGVPNNENKALVSNLSNETANGTFTEDHKSDIDGFEMMKLDFADKLSCDASHSSNENLCHSWKSQNGSPNISLNDTNCNGETKLSNSMNSAEVVKLLDKKQHVLDAENHHSLSLNSLCTVGVRQGSGFILFEKKNGDVHLSSSPDLEGNVEQADNVKGKKTPNSSRHIYIFTNYKFNVYFVSNIMWNAGCSVISSFAPEFLREQGLTPMEAAWLSGAFGMGCFIGGVLGGLFGNFRWVNRQVFYTLSNFVMGITLIAFPNFDNIILYTVSLIISGVAFGVILGLLIVVLTDLIGVESLGNGLGYLMLANGLGTFIGPPLAGVLRDAYGGFESGIIMAGVLCVFGGLIMLLMPGRDLWCCFSSAKKKQLD